MEKAFKIITYAHKCRILDLKKNALRVSIKQEQNGLENRGKHNIMGK